MNPEPAEYEADVLAFRLQCSAIPSSRTDTPCRAAALLRWITTYSGNWQVTKCGNGLDEFHGCQCPPLHQAAENEDIPFANIPKIFCFSLLSQW